MNRLERVFSIFADVLSIVASFFAIFVVLSPGDKSRLGWVVGFTVGTILVFFLFRQLPFLRRWSTWVSLIAVFWIGVSIFALTMGIVRAVANPSHVISTPTPTPDPNYSDTYPPDTLDPPSSSEGEYAPSAWDATPTPTPMSTSTLAYCSETPPPSIFLYGVLMDVFGRWRRNLYCSPTPTQ